jgi:protein involved in polysaccharide export with SLBB domain
MGLIKRNIKYNVIVQAHPNPPPSRGRELISSADKYSPSTGGLWLGANGSRRRRLGGGGAELLQYKEHKKTNCYCRVKLKFLLLFTFSFLLFTACAYYPNIPKIETAKTGNPLPESAKDYLIGPEDILNVVVWDHEDLTRKVQVSRDGRFSYPLIGSIYTDGLTVSQLEKELTDKLSGRYIITPQVTITVEEYHRFFYVFGEVKNPGRYPLQMGTTVLKAISTAAGVTDRAAINGTKLVREEGGVRKEIKAKMDDTVKSEDIIMVPESFF